MKPGQSQFDWGLSYTVYDVREALPAVDTHGNIVGVANERERLQLMTIPFAWRYGVCDGLQFYLNAPLGWSNGESTSDTGDSHTNNFVSMGDMSAGFNMQIMKGCGAYKPDVIASVGFIAPTGHATFATSLLRPTVRWARASGTSPRTSSPSTPSTRSSSITEAATSTASMPTSATFRSIPDRSSTICSASGSQSIRG